jgi:tetratricopeptide (TPR) repeat protein
MGLLNGIPICGVILCIALSPQANGQTPGDTLRLPSARHAANGVPGATPPGTVAPGSAAPQVSNACNDPVCSGIYKTYREAAVGALRSGNESMANVKAQSRDRAIHFYLLSIQRDPTYGRALFNLAVMCVRSVPERWKEALSLYKEAVRIDPSPDIAAAVAKELPRIEAIVRLESTPEGQRARKFDIALVDLIGKFGDPAVALDAAAKLAKSDPTRWEGQAALGILHASLTHYDESGKALEAAARLAPAEWRTRLINAADLAKNEAQYVKARQQADAAYEKKLYEVAGRAYADAWQSSPGRIDSGMLAAVSFLMADRVALAVGVLTDIRKLKSPEYSLKAGLMLKELGAISPDAKLAAEAESSSEAAPVFDVAERIKSIVGDLRSPETLLITGPPPALLGDDLNFYQATDDELTRPKVDIFTSSENLFDVYSRRVGDRRVAMPDGAGAPAQNSNDAPAPASDGPDTTSGPAVAKPARPSRLDTNRLDPGTPASDPAAPAPPAAVPGQAPPR